MVGVIVIAGYKDTSFHSFFKIYTSKTNQKEQRIQKT